jgi:hypothetical protein
MPESHRPEGGRRGAAERNLRIRGEVEALAREFAARVTRVVAEAIASEVEAALSLHVRPAPAATPAPRRPRAAPRRPESVERWVPDRRARRVPNFVIEQTGLRSKREVVERFGEHAIFEKGKPAPAPLRARPAPEAKTAE